MRRLLKLFKQCAIHFSLLIMMTCASSHSWAFEKDIVILPPLNVTCVVWDLRWNMFFVCFIFSLVSASLPFLSCTLAGMEMSASSEMEYWFFSFRGWSGGRGKGDTCIVFFSACEGLLLFPHLARWEKKAEFKAKHLRAFKMVLLIYTLLNLHVTVHAEKTGHIFPGTDQSTFRLFFSDLRFQDTLSGIHACIFIKKIQLSTHPQLLNMEIIVTRIPNLSGYSFQIWLKNLPFYSSLLLV